MRLQTMIDTLNEWKTTVGADAQVRLRAYSHKEIYVEGEPRTFAAHTDDKGEPTEPVTLLIEFDGE